MYRLMNSAWHWFANKIKPTSDNGHRYGLKNYRLELGLLSDTGKTRPTNQDNIGCIRFADTSTLLAIVADGMGGHQGGETASRIAVEALQQHLTLDSLKQNTTQALINGFNQANAAVYQQAAATPLLHGMGTTLVVLAVSNGLAYYANVGDSRLYLLRNSVCRQLSEDHTVVASLVKDGLLAPDAVKNHPDKHLLTHALGTRPQTIIAYAIKPLALEHGDCFLLCSDGLYDLVDEAEFNSIITQQTANKACSTLIELANTRGGFDNISAIVLKIHASDSTPHSQAPITNA